VPAAVKGRQFQILMVEDNLGDARLVREALVEAGDQSDLHVVGDGEAALAFLYRWGEYAASPRPDLILLDLSLPRRNGHEVLAAIKTQEELKRIPVIVLTTSQAQEDILRAYALHANCYISKPLDLEQFFSMVQKIRCFWLSVVELPPE